MREAGPDVEQGMGERRLIFGDVTTEGRQRLTAEGERHAVVERPAAEGEQGSRRVVRRENGRGCAQLVPSGTGRERSFQRDRADFLADPAVNRRRGDRILDVPVGAFVLEADRREHEAGAGGEGDLASAHGPEAQIGLAEAGFGSLPALDRADDRGRQRPGELRLPDEVDVAELRADAEIVSAAARTQLAETAAEPGVFAIDGRHADVTDDFERVGRKQFE